MRMRSKQDQQLLLTVNEIAEKLGVSFWQVRHVVNSRRSIEPAVAHRSVKLYDANGVRQIKAELKAIGTKQAKQRAASTRRQNYAARTVAAGT